MSRTYFAQQDVARASCPCLTVHGLEARDTVFLFKVGVGNA